MQRKFWERDSGPSQLVKSKSATWVDGCTLVEHTLMGLESTDFQFLSSVPETILQNTDCLHFHPWYTVIKRVCFAFVAISWSISCRKNLKILEILEILEFREMHITCLKLRIVINDGDIKASSSVFVVSIYWEICGGCGTTNFAVFGKLASFTQ